MLYNGLDSDLKTFAKFVFIYETKIKNIRCIKDFKSFSKEAFNIFNSDLQPKIKYASMDELASQTDFSKQTLFFPKDKAQILDFCRHLRNAFSHTYLSKKNKKPILLFISDYLGSKKQTCKGFLEYKSVIKFINQVVKDFESLQKQGK